MRGDMRTEKRRKMSGEKGGEKQRKEGRKEGKGKGKDIPCRDIKKGGTSPPFFFVLSTFSPLHIAIATRCSGHGADS